MTSDLEQALRARLRSAADVAAAPVAEILGNVRSRVPGARRRRRSTLVVACSAAGAAVVVVAVALVGSTGQPAGLTPAPADGATPTAITVQSACPDQAAAAMDHEPADLGPVDAAYICGNENRTLSDGSVWQFTVTHKATAGLPALLAAYAVPDASVDATLACQAVGQIISPVFLHSAGRVIAIRPPFGACDAPSAAAQAALSHLTTEVVAVEKGQLMSSAAASAVGCSQAWKDMLHLAIAQTAATGTQPTPFPTSGTYISCSYATPTSPTNNPQLGAGLRLTPADLTALNSALVASAADPGCSTEAHTGFTVVIDPSGGDETYFAVGGCAVQQGQRFWRASPALTAWLATH